MYSKDIIEKQEVAIFFFEMVWVHFFVSRSIIYDRDNRFIDILQNSLWNNLDIKLNIYISFHP
jgi:hypothetical protein